MVDLPIALPFIRSLVTPSPCIGFKTNCGFDRRHALRDAGRSFVLPIRPQHPAASMGGQACLLVPCQQATCMFWPTLQAKGGFLQLSLGDVRDKWGEEASGVALLQAACRLRSEDLLRNGKAEFDSAWPVLGLPRLPWRWCAVLSSWTGPVHFPCQSI